MEKSEELKGICPVCRHVRDTSYQIKVDKEATAYIKNKAGQQFDTELKWLRKSNFMVGEKGTLKFEVGTLKVSADK